MSSANTADDRAFQKQQRKAQAEKRDLKSKVMLGLIFTMGVIYFMDIIHLDSIVYGLVGFIDGMFSTELVPSVKASLGTFKIIVFSFALGGAAYLSKQEA